MFMKNSGQNDNGDMTAEEQGGQTSEGGPEKEHVGWNYGMEIMIKTNIMND